MNHGNKVKLCKGPPFDSLLMLEKRERHEKFLNMEHHSRYSPNLPNSTIVKTPFLLILLQSKYFHRILIKL